VSFGKNLLKQKREESPNKQENENREQGNLIQRLVVKKIANKSPTVKYKKIDSKNEE
jgi:hypothetical protein